MNLVSEQAKKHPDQKKLLKKFAVKGSRERLNRLTGNRSKSPLTWLLTDELADGQTHDTLQAWHKCVRKQKGIGAVAAAIDEFVRELEVEKLSIDQALLSVAAARTFRTIASQVIDFQGLYDALLRLSVNDKDYQLQPWVHQLCCVELPLTLAFDVPEIDPPAGIVDLAIRNWEECVGELLDGDGLINHKYLRVYGPLIACWARSYVLALKLKLDLADEQQLQLEWLVRSYMMLLRPDGTFGGNGYGSLPATEELSRAVLRLSPDKLDRRVAAVCCFKEKRKLRTVPQESALSEWACFGILQAGWKPKTGKCLLTFGKRNCWLEVCREINLLGGECTPQVTFNDETLSIVEDVEVVCWEQDAQGDFVELSFELDKGVRLDRQIYLARDDDFLLIADSVYGETTGRFRYRCDYPFAPGIEGLPETETREVYLKDRKIRSLVLPLELPEWKASRTAGSLSCRDGMLTLTQTSENSKGLYAGLFFDLNRKRSLKPRTWRQLTVGESLQKVRSDVAVAYRVRIDDDQWVIYRSLARNSNRTFIGHNISDGFFIGRFEEDGHIERLLEVE